MVTKIIDGFAVRFGETLGLGCGLIAGLWLIGQYGEYVSKKEEETDKVADPEEDDVKIENIDVD